jgi:hypothetical protein
VWYLCSIWSRLSPLALPRILSCGTRHAVRGRYLALLCLWLKQRERIKDRLHQAVVLDLHRTNADSNGQTVLLVGTRPVQSAIARTTPPDIPRSSDEPRCHACCCRRRGCGDALNRCCRRCWQQSTSARFREPVRLGPLHQNARSSRILLERELLQIYCPATPLPRQVRAWLV